MAGPPPSNLEGLETDPANHGVLLASKILARDEGIFIGIGRHRHKRSNFPWNVPNLPALNPSQLAKWIRIRIAILSYLN